MRLNRILLVPLLAVAVAFGSAGCAVIQKADDFVSAVGSAITAPVNIYRVKLVYDATLTLANKYRDYCYGMRPGRTVALTYAQMMVDPVDKALCQNRRAVVRQMQTGKAKARAAINAAESFGANPPSGLVATAWTAVAQFQLIVDAKRVP